MTPTPTIPVKNVARRPVDLEGGRVLAHGERCDDAPDTPRLRAQIDAGLLVPCEPALIETHEKETRNAAG